MCKEQSGRPLTARTPHNIQLDKDIVKANPKASVQRATSGDLPAFSANNFEERHVAKTLYDPGCPKVRAARL